MLTEIPEDLRLILLEKGHSRIEIGNIMQHLPTGRLTRSIYLDDKEVANLTFPGPEIDWDIVREAVQ